MKRPVVFIAAIVAVAGFGAVAALAKETTKVDTSVTLKEFNWRPGDSEVGSFSGRLKAERGCEKGRTVIVTNDRLYFEVGSDKSNDRGRYRVFYAPDTAGPVVARVKGRTITKNNGDKIVCRPGWSNRVKLELP